MRQITTEAKNAMLNFQSFKSSNTKIETFEVDNKTVSNMLLHNNKIAIFEKDILTGKESLFINSCGWLTNTTKERLNSLPCVSIVQKKGIWFLNGKEWDGQFIQVI